MNIENLNELLLTVQKPGRYIGGEWNSVKKEWTDDKVKVLLAYPDVYEVGSSYLGMKILYGILNERDDCLCERVYSPWADFEEVLRKNNIAIFSLESRRAMKEFDIIGFSLAYELTYTNVLNLLDLGGIPKRSCERGEQDPIIIAGGPSCYNPEPMAEFIDAFLIGDGEDAIGEIVEAYKRARGRKELLNELAKMRGVYVPSLFERPAKIEKRIVEDLDSAYYPVKQIVPNIQIVHDRLAIEIMRGCKHFCKFCQATATYRPWRERSRERILELAKLAYRATGFDEISLLSLSSVDHSSLKETIDELNREFSDRAVSISIPSLRIEGLLKDLPALLSKVKKPVLTFAPEAGTAILRKGINKNIDIEKLLEACLESFKNGWRRVKLYFMIGLPDEADSDIFGIPDLLYKILDLRRRLDGKPARVTASINAFCPKPHTPFQRLGMDSIETLERKKDILKKSIRSHLIELDFHSFQMSLVEAALSRGDRKVGAVINEAWRSGARFDGWSDIFNFNIWMESFKRCGIEAAFYANREIPQDETLPWCFIKTVI